MIRRAAPAYGFLAALGIAVAGALAAGRGPESVDALRRFSVSSPTTKQVLATPKSGATPSGDVVVPATTPDATPTLVEIVHDIYVPASVRVAVGETVRWVNVDGVTHTVTSVDGAFRSGPLHRGGVYRHTFAEPGTYEYVCDLHLEMLGRVVVTAE
jgi:plastocyanin